MTQQVASIWQMLPPKNFTAVAAPARDPTNKLNLIVQPVVASSLFGNYPADIAGTTTA
jgi:hypothetical protein